MKSIAECACTKAILCGEHFVVHGEKAIAIPAKPKNCAMLGETAGSSHLRIMGRTGQAVFTANGKVSGQEALRSFSAVYLGFLKLAGIRKHPGIEIRLKYSGAPKGMGNSASLACAIARALAKYFKVRLAKTQLFNLVQLSEKGAHSNPSGIDAKTVVEGKAQLFRRGMNGKPPEFEQMKVHAPRGASLIIIDTSGGKTPLAKTSDLVEKFTKYLIGNPKEKEIRKSYRKILSGLIAELKKENPNPEILGKLMGENHILLKQGGVSSHSIEKAISAVSPFSYGAKLTGAGGEGGAAIALIRKSGISAIKKRLGKAGFSVIILG